MGNGKSGRPTKATPETLKIIIDAVSEGLTYETSAALAGITYQTLHDWKKKGGQGDPVFVDFAEKLMVAEAEGEYTLLANIRRAGESQWQASAWILERRYPQRYGRVDRLKAELTGKDGDPVQIAKSTSDEEIEAHIKRIMKRHPELAEL